VTKSFPDTLFLKGKQLEGLYLMLTEHFSDCQTDRIKERTCFSEGSKGVLLHFKGVKRNRSLQGGSFHSTQHGSLVLLFSPLLNVSWMRCI